jgi:carbohydrate-selective porin OprB
MSCQRTWRWVSPLAGSALFLWIGTGVVDAADWTPTTPGVLAIPDDRNSFKTYFRERGVDLQLGCTSELATNATGGIKSSAAYADQYTVEATLDLDRLARHPRHDIGRLFSLQA